MMNLRVKTCPFKQGLAPTNQFTPIFVDPSLKHCDEAGCQIWVELRKPRTYSTREHPFLKTADPEYEYRYSGCGLIKIIPWELVKIEKEGEKKNE